MAKTIPRQVALLCIFAVSLLCPIAELVTTRFCMGEQYALLAPVLLYLLSCTNTETTLKDFKILQTLEDQLFYLPKGITERQENAIKICRPYISSAAFEPL